MSIEQALATISNQARISSKAVGAQIFRKRYPTTGSLPIVEDYNANNAEIYFDLNILYEKYQNLAGDVSDYFNYRQTEKERLNDRIKYLNSICSNLSTVANANNPNHRYISDTFSNIDSIDIEATSENLRAHIATREGVVTLKRTDSMNRSVSATISETRGNGMAGDYHVVAADSGLYKYLSDNDPHDDISKIIDNSPDTWYEYQMINVPEELKPSDKSEMEWAVGEKNTNLLRLKIIIDLGKMEEINWIVINPYSPPSSNGKLTVYSIKTSRDGFNYASIYDGITVLNTELNKFAESFRDEDIVISGYTSSKFAGQGVWSFEAREARYIEVMIDQPDSYDEYIGHTIYFNTRIEDGKEVKISMKEKDVPVEIANSPVGKYALGSNEFIEKTIEAIPGWRYCIGLRDINVYSYKFAPKSELISKTFTVDKPIKEISLIVNEKIPPTFLADITKANSWLEYYISIDDGHEWHKISPSHRRPMGDERQATTGVNLFPPKIYEINSIEIDEIKYDKIYKGYLKSDSPVTTIKLKIEISRPENSCAITPLIEDYTLKILTEDV